MRAIISVPPRDQRIIQSYISEVISFYYDYSYKNCF